MYLTENFLMKRIFTIFLVLSLYLVFSPGFHCGETRPCVNAGTDTVALNFTITNPSAVYHINDSVKLFSAISDSMYSIGGVNFVSAINRLNAQVVPYRITYDNTYPQLAYATNKFDPVVHTGYLQNPGAYSYDILFNRLQPYNILSTYLVPKDTGLYMIKVNLYNFASGYDFEIYNAPNMCITYKGFAEIPVLQQQRQYWNDLGIINIASIYNLQYSISKEDRNYFFIKVVP